MDIKIERFNNYECQRVVTYNSIHKNSKSDVLHNEYNFLVNSLRILACLNYGKDIKDERFFEYLEEFIIGHNLDDFKFDSLVRFCEINFKVKNVLNKVIILGNFLKIESKTLLTELFEKKNSRSKTIDLITYLSRLILISIGEMKDNEKINEEKVLNDLYSYHYGDEEIDILFIEF